MLKSRLLVITDSLQGVWMAATGDIRSKPGRVPALSYRRAGEIPSLVVGGIKDLNDKVIAVTQVNLCVRQIKEEEEEEGEKKMHIDSTI